MKVYICITYITRIKIIKLFTYIYKQNKIYILQRAEKRIRVQVLTTFMDNFCKKRKSQMHFAIYLVHAYDARKKKFQFIYCIVHKRAA